METRHRVRQEMGWYDKLAAEMFALVVFVSDGLLQINETTTPSPAARFLSIAIQLPLELQMVLCFRQVGSAKDISLAWRARWHWQGDSGDPPMKPMPTPLPSDDLEVRPPLPPA